MEFDGLRPSHTLIASSTQDVYPWKVECSAPADTAPNQLYYRRPTLTRHNHLFYRIKLPHRTTRELTHASIRTQRTASSALSAPRRAQHTSAHSINNVRNNPRLLTGLHRLCLLSSAIPFIFTGPCVSLHPISPACSPVMYTFPALFHLTLFP